MSQRSQSALTIFSNPLQFQNQTNAILKIKEMVCFSYFNFPIHFLAQRKYKRSFNSHTRRSGSMFQQSLQSYHLLRFLVAVPLCSDQKMQLTESCFGHRWSRSRTTKNVTPAMLYSEHVRKELKAFNAYNKKMTKAAALGKKVNLREVQPVKFSHNSQRQKSLCSNKELPKKFLMVTL